MGIKELMNAVDELRRLGYDPTAPELACMIDCAHEGEAVEAYIDEYGGFGRSEALTAAERNQ